jgi:secreted trypsin-like serine protease
MILLFLVAICTASAEANSKWRVINGQTTLQHEFPSIVSLRVNGNHICGGTLLNANSVLTAAHCIYPPPPNMEVVAGEHSIYYDEGGERSVQVARIVRHPGYIHNAWNGDDIAILKLARPIQQEQHIRYVSLAQRGARPEGCQVVGWGATDPSGRNAAPILQKAILQIVPNDACANNFPQTRGNVKQICAGGGSTRNSACRGDSGGPLYCQQGGRTVQVGVVSFGTVPCAQPNTPAVFTRVETYLDWIQQQGM